MPTPAECALLCAAAASGTVPEGWEAEHTVYGSDALLIGRALHFGWLVRYGYVFRRGDEAVLAIRGTHGLLEWLEDFEAIPVPADVGPGMVEAGFVSLYNSLCVKDTLPLFTVLSEYSNLTIAGHSLGAVLATYALADMPSARGVFIASPHPGDGDYAAGYAPTNYMAYRYQRDLIPALPPIGFTHLPCQTVLPVDPQTPDLPVENHSILNYAKWLKSYA